MLELMFKAAHLVAMVGWLCLFFSPIRLAALIYGARLVALALAAAYTLAFFASASAASVLVRDYSLAGVGSFFADPTLRLVGWVHYLAFDLWVGSWEAEEAHRIGLPYSLLLPSLVLTFLVGPVGLLAFMLVRAARLRMPTTADGREPGS